nr:hypothetical protein [Vibrio rhodolitus]
MKKRLLPIPLILLIPILLLVVVILAGLYRFSLDDEDILAKFPSQNQSFDRVVEQVFAIRTPNPWTIQVPESTAFAFMDQVIPETQSVSGAYDDGVERGLVNVSTQWLTTIEPNSYLSVMTVSNQGSGIFSYLATFRYDVQRKRMVLIDTLLIGDRIAIDGLTYHERQVDLSYRQHSENQAMAESPNQPQSMHTRIDSNLTFSLHEK